MSIRALHLATLLVLASASASHAADRALVFGSDYSTGSLSAITTAGPTPACDIASPHSDARLRYFAGQLFVVNRFGADNIQVVEPMSGATVLQFSVGNGANPYDIAVLSPTRAYVTRYDRRELWIVNPATGAKTGEVDLGGFADADGIPEMDRIAVVGPLAFVSLQRLDRPSFFSPTDSSLVAVIDTRADTLVDCDAVTPGVQAIRLPVTNPVTTFEFDRAQSRLLLGCVGNYGVLDGGIVAVDPVALTAGPVLVTDADLGGDCNDLVWVSDTRVYAIVSTPSFATQLVRWDPVAGMVSPPLFAPGGFVLADAEWDGAGELWVADNRAVGGGIRRFSVASGAAIGVPLVCTLPAQALVFDRASGPFAGVGGQGAALALAAPWPNPVRTSARVALTLPVAARVVVEVLDAAGRRVARLVDATEPAGRREWAWDLSAADGSRVAPGLYLVRARAGAAEATRRLLVLR
jgi:hypothetical protein